MAIGTTVSGLRSSRLLELLSLCRTALHESAGPFRHADYADQELTGDALAPSVVGAHSTNLSAAPILAETEMRSAESWVETPMLYCYSARALF
jgi:hypothetical protein